MAKTKRCIKNKHPANSAAHTHPLLYGGSGDVVDAEIVPLLEVESPLMIVDAPPSKKQPNLLQMAASELDQLIMGTNKRAHAHRVGCGINKSTKSTPMTYGESQRMVQLEFTPQNSNVTNLKIFLKLVTENLIYLLNVDNKTSPNDKGERGEIDDYVNAIGSVFRVDSRAESTAPVIIQKSGPRVMGGGLVEMNNANNVLLDLRSKRFPQNTPPSVICGDNCTSVNTNSSPSTVAVAVAATTTTTTTQQSNKDPINVNSNLSNNITNNTPDSTLRLNGNGQGNSHSNTNDKDKGQPSAPIETLDITKRFNVRSSNVFTFERTLRKSSASSNLIMNRSNVDKKSHQRSMKNNDTNDNGNILPQPSFKVNTTLDLCLKAMFGELNTDGDDIDNGDGDDDDEWWLNECAKPVYFAEKTKLVNSTSLYQYSSEEQKRYLNDLHYDMDEQDLAFLICVNIRRVVEWSGEGHAFFSDPETEEKFLETSRGLDSSSWNFFVENLLFPGIMSERLPQNCFTNITTLLVNGITFEGIIDKLERMAKYESRNLLGETVNPKVVMQESYCEICNDDECGIGNVIVYCDVCNIGVHQECYGIPYIPDDAWICQRCNASPSNTISCCLCPNNYGVMKQTDQHQWCHMVCALWIGDVTFANTVFLEPIDTHLVSVDRLKLTCTICNVKCGACIQCMHLCCYVAMHVSCAQAAGLLVFQITKRFDHNGNVTEIHPKFKSYCPFHINKAMNSHTSSYTVVDEKKHTETRYIISKTNYSNMMSTTTILNNKDDNLLLHFHNDQLKCGVSSNNSNASGNGNNERQPIVQISCIDENQLNELSTQLPLYNSKQLVHDIYQYWLIKRFVRCGSPLVRGLTAMIAAATAATTTTTSATTTTTTTNANTTTNNNIMGSTTNNNNSSNDDDNRLLLSLTAQYEQASNDFKIAKSKLNQLNVIEFLTYFETVIWAIIKLFIELVVVAGDDDSLANNSASPVIATKVHNLRAYMIRNLAILDPKCPSYLKNIVYPLDLFDQLHNFSLNYLVKLYDLSPRQASMHNATKNSYHRMFMTIRTIVRRRFPIGKFKFNFINTFKEQLRNKNYTMSHDMEDDSILYKTKTIDEHLLDESIVEKTKNNPFDVIEPETIKPVVRKSRKGIPERAPSSYEQIAKGVIIASKVYDSTNGRMTRQHVITPSVTCRSRLPPSSGVVFSTDDNQNQVVEATAMIVDSTVVDMKPTRQNPLKITTQEPQQQQQKVSIDNLPIVARRITRNCSSNTNDSSSSGRKNSKSNLATTTTTTTDTAINSISHSVDANKVDTKMSTTRSLRNRNYVQSSSIDNDNAEDDSKIQTNKNVSRKRSRNEMAADSQPLKSKSKSLKIDNIFDNNSFLKIPAKMFDKLKSLQVLHLFNMVQANDIYYSLKPPHKLLRDPKSSPIVLEDYSVVWAKIYGYAAYPGIVINENDIDHKLLSSKYRITSQNIKNIQKFINNKYRGNINNTDDGATAAAIRKLKNIDTLYVVVFFDASRSFQILSRKSLQPLGVDAQVDHRCLYNFYRGKSLRLLDSFNEAYTFALSVCNKLFSATSNRK